MNRFKGVGLALVLALLLSLVFAEGIAQAQGRSVFGWIVASRLTVSNTTELQSTLDVDGAATLASATVEGDTVLAARANFTEQGAVTVVNGGNITPTGVYMPLTSSGNVGTASVLTTTATAGDLLVFINTANTTITLTDTAPLRLSGNIGLGQYDTLTLWFDGSTWIQLATTNN